MSIPPIARTWLTRLLPVTTVWLFSVAPTGAAGVLDYSFNPLVPSKPIALKDYAGKVVLVVNTASQCGYTPQYESLEKLYKKYQDKGLIVLGIPANDFGAQEPGSNKDIAQFCSANFGVSFPMTEKLGTTIAQNPFYAQLIKSTGQAPQWNFHKYLIDRSGKVASYKSGVEPLGRELTAAVEAALSAR